MNIDRTEPYSLHLISADRRLTVWAKLDSCVEVHAYANDSVAGDVKQDSDVDLLHACDFDTLLRELLDAKAKIDAWETAQRTA